MSPTGRHGHVFPWHLPRGFLCLAAVCSRADEGKPSGQSLHGGWMCRLVQPGSCLRYRALYVSLSPWRPDCGYRPGLGAVRAHVLLQEVLGLWPRRACPCTRDVGSSCTTSQEWCRWPRDISQPWRMSASASMKVGVWNTVSLGKHVGPGGLRRRSQWAFSVAFWTVQIHPLKMELPGGSVVKNPPARAEDARDAGSIPESGRSPRDRNGYPLQYSCLENPHGQRSLVGLQSMGS